MTTTSKAMTTRGGGGFSPVFVLPEDGLRIEAEIVPGEETMLRSGYHYDVFGRLAENRAHRITRRHADGSVWGVLDEFDLLYSIREGNQPETKGTTT